MKHGTTTVAPSVGGVTEKKLNFAFLIACLVFRNRNQNRKTAVGRAICVSRENAEERVSPNGYKMCAGKVRVSVVNYRFVEVIPTQRIGQRPLVSKIYQHFMYNPQTITRRINNLERSNRFDRISSICDETAEEEY